MHHRERVSRARLAVHGDKHATTGGQCLENPAIVRLKPDTTERVGIGADLTKGDAYTLLGVRKKSALDSMAAPVVIEKLR